MVRQRSREASVEKSASVDEIESERNVSTTTEDKEESEREKLPH